MPQPNLVPQQNLMHQFNPQSQPVLSSSQQQQQQPNQVQYVQLSNGLLVPLSSTSHPNLHMGASPNTSFANNQVLTKKPL